VQGRKYSTERETYLWVVHPLLLEAARCYIGTPLEEEMARARDDGVSRVSVGGMMECGGAVGPSVVEGGKDRRGKGMDAGVGGRRDVRD
jgi:hypothetical protein